MLIKKNNLTCGIKADIWHSPLVLDADKALNNIEEVYYYNFPEEELKKKKMGCSLTLITNYRVKKLPLFLEMAIGYKTKGYLPGESLKQSPIARIGFEGSF